MMNFRIRSLPGLNKSFALPVVEAQQLVSTASPIPPPSSSKDTAAAAYTWILNPTIDILFACGGLIWVAYGFALLGIHPATGAGVLAGCLWWATKFGTIVFSNAHQPATLWRVYLSPKTRKACGTTVTLWGILTIALYAASIRIPGVVEIFLKVIIFWSIQHTLAQAYGVSLIYCYKRRYFLNEFEKRTLLWMINSAIIFFIVRMCTFEELGSGNFTGIPINFWGPVPMWIYYLSATVFGALVMLFAYNIIEKYKRDKMFFPWPALANIATGFSIYFSNVISGMQADFGVFVAAYYHASQYMVVTSAYYLKERGLPEGMPFSNISHALMTKAAFKYLAILVVVGWLLAQTLPRWLQALGVGPSAAIFAASFCALNFHHYFTDALIWKLKDPEVRKLLIS
ncbi:hypothetical protein BH10CYA1_BH10CYA1_20130 [soil metagenome]